MSVTEYKRGIPEFEDESGNSYGLLCKTVEECITDKNGLRLDHKLENMQTDIERISTDINTTINEEIDKKVGDLTELPTEDKTNIVSSLDELKQNLDEKWQFVPIQAEITQNPETFEPGHVYIVEGDEVFEEDGHPYSINLAHITYLVYGDEENKVIIAIYGEQEKVFIKTQKSGVWKEWFEIADTSILRKAGLGDYVLGYNEWGLFEKTAFLPMTFFTAWTTYDELPAKYGSGVIVPGLDSFVKFIYYMVSWNENIRSWLGVMRFTDNTSYSINWQEVITNKTVSNANILINTDFSNPINQRNGDSYVSITSYKYTIDRWELYGGTLEFNDDSISLIKNANQNEPIVFRQQIEMNLVGKTVTLSLSANGKIYSTTCYINSSNLQSNVAFIPSTVGSGIADFRADIFTVNGRTSARIYYDSVSSEDEWLTVEWIKLEFGTVATQFVPPNQVGELMKCKRYYQRMNGNGMTVARSASGNLISNTKFQVQMRVEPTIRTIGSFISIYVPATEKTLVSSNGSWLFGFLASQTGIQWFTINTSLFTDIPNIVGYIGYIDNSNDILELDAEIY